MMKILILEDNPERMKYFKEKFKNNADIIHTEYSETAITYLKQVEFDIVFLDHDLGGKQMDWEEENCGMNVVDWLVENIGNLKYNPEIIIHSFNFVRSEIMLDKLLKSGYTARYIPGYWLDK